MGERRGDGMTAIKIAMNNYQSCLQTNTKISKLFKKGFYFLKCRFSFLIILQLHQKQYFLARIASAAAIFYISVKKRNIVIMDPRSACALFMKIHFVGKSLWVMQNNNGFFACFLKILDKKRKKLQELLTDQYPIYFQECQQKHVFFCLI